MTAIHINEQGVVTSGPPEEPVEIYIENFSNTASNVFLSTDEDGMVVTRSIETQTFVTNSYAYYSNSIDPPFEFWAHSGSQIASGNLVYNPLKINGIKDSYRGGRGGGLNCWNTSSNVFTPDSLTSSYTVRINGNITPHGGNPVFQLDFALSGSSPQSVFLSAKGMRHHQSWEKTIRNGSHEHIMGTYQIFSDEDLFASGGQFYMSSDGPSLEVVSASILITKR
jgi:hypothetical protein